MSKQAIKTLITSTQVYVFSKSYCPYCIKAKQLLEKLDVKFGVKELDKMRKTSLHHKHNQSANDAVADGAEVQNVLQEMTGQRTVPNIFINGKHLGGCDTLQAQLASGELKKLLAQPFTPSA